MEFNLKTVMIAVLGISAVGSAYVCFRSENLRPRQKPATVLRDRRIRSVKAAKTSQAVRIAEKRRATELNDDFSRNPFKLTHDDGWDEERDLSPELKALVAELNEAMNFERAEFDGLAMGKGRRTPESRERLLKAIQHMLAIMTSKGYESVPSWLKHEALGALGWNGGSAGIAETLGFLTDEDPTVSSAASSLLMDQLMDFDTTESDMMSIITQLAKMSLTSGELESILFTVSSFKTSNKVAATLALYDNGNANVRDLVIKNADFVFEEAEADSIQRREDIVQYGKDHPDGSGMDFDLNLNK